MVWERIGAVMDIVAFISNLIIPVLIFYIIGYGLLNKVDIFDAFINGAADGFKVVINILPDRFNDGYRAFKSVWGT